jgi:hypothetical protein
MTLKRPSGIIDDAVTSLVDLAAARVFAKSRTLMQSGD